MLGIYSLLGIEIYFIVVQWTRSILCFKLLYSRYLYNEYILDYFLTNIRDITSFMINVKTVPNKPIKEIYKT